jgi:hypothetical protein
LKETLAQIRRAHSETAAKFLKSFVLLKRTKLESKSQLLALVDQSLEQVVLRQQQLNAQLVAND